MTQKSAYPGQANPYFSPFLYWIGKGFTKYLFNIVWRRTASGTHNIPPAGTPVIFAANHRSYADPNLVGTMVPYPIHYFAKEELFHVPLLGWYIRRVNSFPVRRGDHDVGAFKNAMRILRSGEGLLLFPEGGRRLDPARQFKAKAGVAMLAARTGACVVPVGIRNSDRMAKFPRVHVAFGRPVPAPNEDESAKHQEFTDDIMKRIKALCEGVDA